MVQMSPRPEIPCRFRTPTSGPVNLQKVTVHEFRWEQGLCYGDQAPTMRIPTTVQYIIERREEKPLAGASTGTCTGHFQDRGMVMVRQSFEEGLFLCVVSGREPQGFGFAVSSVLGSLHGVVLFGAASIFLRCVEPPVQVHYMALAVSWKRVAVRFVGD